MSIEIAMRDEMGTHPFFYYHKGDVFLYGNSLREIYGSIGFEKELNINALALYLKYGFIPEPYTIYKNTFKLKAGHSLKYCIKKNEIVIDKYWDVLDLYKLKKLNLSDSEAVEQTEYLMRQSFEGCFDSHASSGVLLSGGYDSAAVAALLQSNRSTRIKTFTIGFHEQKHNEAHHAKRIAAHLGTEHTDYYCTQKDAITLLAQLPEVLDEPLGDVSIIPTTLACQLAAAQVGAILSADGADELLGGYDKYLSISRKKRTIGRIPGLLRPALGGMLRSDLMTELAGKVGVANARHRLGRLSLQLGANEKQLLESGAQEFTQLDLNQLLVEKVISLNTNFDEEINGTWLENILALDLKTYAMDGVLVKVYQAASYAGIVNLEPMLHPALVEHFIRLRPDMKIRDGCKKFILKEVVHKHIPKDMMDRPKMGFGVPLEDWFQDELKVFLLDYLNESRIKKAGIFNVAYVTKLRDDYFRGKKHNITKLWYLLVFEMWRERWM